MAIKGGHIFSIGNAIAQSKGHTLPFDKNVVANIGSVFKLYIHTSVSLFEKFLWTIYTKENALFKYL